MTTATAATRLETWEVDVQATCDRCLAPVSVTHLRRITVHGVGLDVCTTCTEYLGRQHPIDRALALRRLARTYAGGVGAAA
jgi:hypothetical protein